MEKNEQVRATKSVDDKQFVRLDVAVAADETATPPQATNGKKMNC